MLSYPKQQPGYKLISCGMSTTTVNQIIIASKNVLAIKIASKIEWVRLLFGWLLKFIVNNLGLLELIVYQEADIDLMDHIKLPISR